MMSFRCVTYLPFVIFDLAEGQSGRCNVTSIGILTKFTDMALKTPTMTGVTTTMPS